MDIHWIEQWIYIKYNGYIHDIYIYIIDMYIYNEYWIHNGIYHENDNG